MSREVRDKRPYVKPVEKIELSEKHLLLRGIVAVILLAIGVTALAFTFKSFLSPEDGWSEVTIDSSTDVVCRDEFTLYYDLGASGIETRNESNLIKEVYSLGMAKMSHLLDEVNEYEGVKNICYINKHPNEVIEIDEDLYNVFSKIASYNNRMMYLQPLYSYYDDLFCSSGDNDAVEFDPYENEELRELFAEIAKYANDEKAINLELLGNNKVKLYVSDEYKRFCKENIAESYIGMMIMKNAFMVDYLADALIEKGHTLGTLTSYDGYARTLSDEDVSYYQKVYSRYGDYIYDAGLFEYKGKSALVYFRDYELDQKDVLHYYSYHNHTVRTSYLSMEDGLDRCVNSELICYSHKKKCVDIMLSMMPIYISDSFETDSLKELKSNGIFSVYGKDGIFYMNDKDSKMNDLYDKDGVTFKAEYVD